MEFTLPGLLYIVLSLLLGVGIYYSWNFMKNAAEIIFELLVMLRIFTGGSRRYETKRPLRMYTYTSETQYLDEVTINELYNFLYGSGMIESEMGGGKDETIAFFHKAMLSYSHVIMFRDKIDGSLRGVTTMGISHVDEHTEICIGWTFFKNYYKGGPFLYLALGYFILKELILHPFTPTYLVGKTISYHSYLAVMKFKEGYPRYDTETPEQLKKIIDNFARSGLHEEDTYDEKTNIIIPQKVNHLPESLSAVSEKDLQNPHIKFFVERNPGYTKGHILAMALRMSWSNLMTFATESFMKSFQRSKLRQGGAGRTREKKPKPLLTKRFTFQEESANAYVVNMYQVDLAGEAVLSPARKHHFAFGPLSPSGSPLHSPTSAVPDLKCST